MQSYPRTAIVESRKQESPRIRVMVGGMVLTLAAVVTAGAVLTARHNGWGASTRTAAHPAVVRAAQAGDRAAQRAASDAVASRPRQLPAASTVYLTDDAVEAAEAQAELDTLAVPARTGQTPSSVVTMVVPGEAAEAFQAIADENRTRTSLNLPEIAVVDPRSSSTSQTGAAASARRAIADENSLRVSLGLPEIAASAAE